MKQEIILHWSGGKDAALSYYKLGKAGYHIHRLLTTINEKRQRITMHGVRKALIKAQVEAMGQMLEFVALPESISMGEYTGLMENVLLGFKEQGIIYHAYGDIFLEDLKAYRNQALAKNQLEGIYPLWGMNSSAVISTFFDLGFKAIVVAVSAAVLDKSFVGRTFDASFLADLPEGIDPCGENGEFHTFMYDGPIFTHPIAFEVGEVTYKTYHSQENDDDCFCRGDETKKWDTGFWFCDLDIPKTS